MIHYEAMITENLCYYRCRMPPKAKRARLTFYDSCQVCGANSPHVYRRMLRVHLPCHFMRRLPYVGGE